MQCVTENRGRKASDRSNCGARPTCSSAKAKTVAQQSDHLLTEPDEFTMTDVEERKWIQEHLDGPGNLCLLEEASGVILMYRFVTA
jgi:hypothetical protein